MSRQCPATFAFILTCLFASGCSPVRPSTLDEAMAAAHVNELRKARSAAELRGYIQRNHSVHKALHQERNRTFCADPKHEKHWRCHPQHTLERIVSAVVGSRISDTDLITNNQETGVDEGDIIKKSGNRLFVLRRGVLYSIDIMPEGSPGLAAVARLKIADHPDDDSVWYDEILAAGDTLILLGFDWDKDRSLLWIYDIDANGRLSQRARYGVPGNDYFSDSNYGSRIESDNLLLSLSVQLDEHLENWPMWTRLDHPGQPEIPMLKADDVHLPLSIDPWPTLHLIARCPLATLGRDQFHCSTTGIIGGDDSTFYASTRAAYLAVSSWETSALLDPQFDPWMSHRESGKSHLKNQRYSTIYRIDFAGDLPLGMAQARNIAGDQFSLAEHDDALLLVSHQVDKSTPVAHLQRIRLDRFASQPGNWPEEIAQIPISPTHHNFRFSADALWIGGSSSRLNPDTPPLLRQPLDGSPHLALPLQHSANTLQPVGRYLLALGHDGQKTWHASLVRDQAEAHISDSVKISTHQPSEHRSHAINFASYPAGDWLVGFPGIAANKMPDPDSEVEPLSDLLLYRIANDRLIDIGTLSFNDSDVPDCPMGCYDWYGNARIFFIGSRIFALSGNILVEARLKDGALVEHSRVILN